MNNFSLRTLRGQIDRTQRSLDKAQADAKAEYDAPLPTELELVKGALSRTKHLLKWGRSLISSFDASMSRIEALLSEHPDQELDNEMDKYGETSLNSLEWISRLECFVEELTEAKGGLEAQATTAEHNTSSGSTSSSNLEEQLGRLLNIATNQQRASTPRETSSSIRKPKLELQKFDGNVFRWKSFWEFFKTTVDDDRGLSNVEKLAYLRSSLQGEPLRIVDFLELSNENYSVAVEMLQEQYGRTDVTVTRIHTQLMNIAPVPNDPVKIKEFYIEMKSALGRLRALGQETEDKHFVSLIYAKLPYGFKLQVDRRRRPRESWTVKDLMESINAELEVLLSSREESRRNDYRNQQTFERNRYDTRSTGEALLGSQGNKSNMVDGRPLRVRCAFCEDEHYNDECKRYRTAAERRMKLGRRCYVCLREGHVSRECPNKHYVCHHCREVGRHHRSLCPKKFGPFGIRKSESAQVTTEAETEEVDQMTIMYDDGGTKDESGCLAAGESVLLQTALVKVRTGTNDGSIQTRLLLDCGSNRSYITEKLASKLKLKVSKGDTLSISRFASNKPVDVPTQTAVLEVMAKDRKLLKLTVSVVPKITGTLTRIPVRKSMIRSVCQGLVLADNIPDKVQKSDVHLLIGNDYYLEVVTSERIFIRDGLFLLGSVFGWIMTGRTSNKLEHKIAEAGMMCFSTKLDELPDVAVEFPDSGCSAVSKKPTLEDLWSLESIGISDKIEETADDKALDRFNETVRFSGGRYEVTWPWKENAAFLPTNYGLALGRLRGLMRRLECRPELVAKYDAIMKDQEAKGIIGKVGSNAEKGHKVHYLAHHPVETPQKATTKVRIVYDASAHVSKESPSLNDCLHRGPVLLNHLLGLLLKFRMYSVVMMADIEKAYLQVGLQETERDAVRFIWLKDATKPPTNENLQIYHFRRVPFGVVSSQFLLDATVRFHLQQQNSQVALMMRDSMYSDNLITGAQSVSEACQIYKEGKRVVSEASMNLREWMSNSEEVMESIAEIDRVKDDTVKVLGINWSMKTDAISVKGPTYTELSGATTKRQILSVLAKLFDPLGFFSLITIRGRVLLQELNKIMLKYNGMK